MLGWVPMGNAALAVCDYFSVALAQTVYRALNPRLCALQSMALLDEPAQRIELLFKHSMLVQIFRRLISAKRQDVLNVGSAQQTTENAFPEERSIVVERSRCS